MKCFVIDDQDVGHLFRNNEIFELKSQNLTDFFKFTSKTLSENVSFTRNQSFFKQCTRIKRNTSVEMRYVSIYFMSQGKLRTKMKDWKYAEHFFTGKFCLSFSPSPYGFLEHVANQPSLSYGLHIKLPYWQNAVLQDKRLGLQMLFSRIFKPTPEPMLLSGIINPYIAALISDCESHQTPKKNNDLLINELLNAVLDEIAARYCIDEARLVLNPTDLKKLQTVKEILSQEMHSPHTLKALAHRTGLNEFKLKKGFKTITQQTIGQYIQSLRMCQAAQLIRESNQPIIDIACHVGCNNHGHFSVAFKKYFGQSPSAYRVQHR